MSDQEIDTRVLRSALEFAVLMAAEGRKFRPPLPAPDGLRRFASKDHIPTRSLASIRRLVEDDPVFRERIAHGALPELVDPIGIMWLRRPDGWERDIHDLIEAARREQEAVDAERQLRRAEKRRAAAEQAAIRSRAEIAGLAARVEELEAQVADAERDGEQLRAERDAARAEAGEHRIAARHAADRAAAAAERVAALEAERDQAVTARSEAAEARDAALTDRVRHTATSADLAAIAETARGLAERLAGIVPVDQRAERRPLAIPGGVLGTSTEAAEHLLSAGASVLVDGYNVGKLAWPDATLADQRELTIDTAERVARRFGADVAVVFDGTDVVGAHADRRRTVRVVFSRDDELADDVLRSEVRRLPPARHVVVVTNDRAVVTDVRAQGANTLTSEQFIAASS